jgi:hypothetical protein
VDRLYAYFVAADRHVVIVADVFLNPVADHVEICPNPIAMPPSREYVVLGTTDGGIHPSLMVRRRLSTTFASDATPARVIVYSRGDDGPARHELAVSSHPPPPLGDIHVPRSDQSARR